MAFPSKPLNLTGQINYNNNTIEYQWQDSDTETSYQIRDMAGATPDVANDPIVLDNIPANTTTIPYTSTSWIRTESNVTDGSITKAGTWTSYSNTNASNGNFDASNTTGSKITFNFTGNKLRWIGTKSDIAGIADIYLDGVKVATIDGYNSTFAWKQVLYESSELNSGSHILEIVVTGTKNASSTNTYVYVDAFDINSSTTLPYDPNRYEYTRYVVAVNADGSTPSDPLTLYSKTFNFAGITQLSINVESLYYSVPDYQGISSLSLGVISDVSTGSNYDGNVALTLNVQSEYDTFIVGKTFEYVGISTLSIGVTSDNDWIAHPLPTTPTITYDIATDSLQITDTFNSAKLKIYKALDTDLNYRLAKEIATTETSYTA